ncbi:MAG: hypothetical protein LBR92_00230 [Puniceicoccales bacterium]|jgi:hypothetical protein|nr:hypothetical protein [Puniceicoccales bacterium]
MVKIRNELIVGTILVSGVLSNHVFGSEKLGPNALTVDKTATEPRSLEALLWDAIEVADGPNSVPELERLIREGANVVTNDHHGSTPLYITCCTEGLELFLRHTPPIDIDSRDNYQNTALHHFIQLYLTDIDPEGEEEDDPHRREIFMLVGHGANPCLKGNDGKTPRQLVQMKKMTFFSEDPEALSEVRKRLANMASILRDAEEKWHAAHPIVR